MSIMLATDGHIRFFEAESEIVIVAPIKGKAERVPKVCGKAERVPAVKGKVRTVRIRARVSKCEV